MKKLVASLTTALIFAFITAGTMTAQETADTSTLVYLCRMDKMIAAPLWRSVKKSFLQADTMNADYMLIKMNTYGGQVDIALSLIHI